MEHNTCNTINKKTALAESSWGKYHSLNTELNNRINKNKNKTL